MEHVGDQVHLGRGEDLTEFLIVLDPVITGIEVDDVSQQCEDEDPQHDAYDLQ